MSGIAEVLHKKGYRVSGSDVQLSPVTENLRKTGIAVFEGHRQENIKDADVLVCTSAVDSSNPEIKAAQKRSIPIIKRAEMLAEIIHDKYCVAISGAHGKTSTTSLTSSVLREEGLDPMVVVGGLMRNSGTNAHMGSGSFAVIEADESDGSFLNYDPTIAVVTNIDLEHLDYYDGISDIKQIFLKFLSQIKFYGLAILCTDNHYVREILPSVTARKMTYGIDTDADLMAKEIIFTGSSSEFTVVHQGKKLGRVELNLPGIHNIYNSLAAIGVGIELSIPFGSTISALKKTGGVGRRIEIKGELNDVIIIDDYGHHPTEIQTTLAAIKKSWPGKKLVTVFQPHRYSRTKKLLTEFSEAFDDADSLYILPIYAASEKNSYNITDTALSDKIKNRGRDSVYFMSNRDSCISALEEYKDTDCIILTIGAGDVYKTGEELLNRLSK